MGSDLTVKDLVKETAALQKLLGRFEARPWTAEAFVIELLAEAGTLADSVMIKEGYRKLRDSQDAIDLEDDICDVLFVLLMIADHYGIDIGKSYLFMVNTTRKKLEKK